MGLVRGPRSEPVGVLISSHAEALDEFWIPACSLSTKCGYQKVSERVAVGPACFLVQVGMAESRCEVDALRAGPGAKVVVFCFRIRLGSPHGPVVQQPHLQQSIFGLWRSWSAWVQCGSVVLWTGGNAILGSEVDIDHRVALARAISAPSVQEQCNAGRLDICLAVDGMCLGHAQWPELC